MDGLLLCLFTLLAFMPGWCAMSKSKNAMKPDEQAAMDGMIAAARDRSKGGLVKLGKRRDKIQISGLGDNVPVWLCGWMRDPDTERAGPTIVGWRYTEEENGALCVECAGYFDRAIEPPRVVLHGPSGTERLRG